MVKSFRTTLRAKIRDLVSQIPEMEDVTELRAFPQDVDHSHFPFFVVRIPFEDTEIATVDMVSKVTQLTVHLRRLGGDALEDQIDDDADILEKTIVSHLDEIGFDGHLSRAEFNVLGDAGKRIGQLDLSFRVTRYV